MGNSKEKQIEEMAKDLAIARNCICKDIGGLCNECTWRVGCYFIEITKTLVEKGYRKASEVARDIFAEIETSLHYKFINGETHLIIRETDYKELKKKYTEEGK